MQHPLIVELTAILDSVRDYPDESVQTAIRFAQYKLDDVDDFGIRGYEADVQKHIDTLRSVLSRREIALV